MSLTWLRALTMNLRLLPRRHQMSPINLLVQRRLWRSVVNYVWVSSCFCSSCGCSAKWEEGEQDTTLLIMVPGEEARGAAIPGEEEHIEAFHPEASPRVEVEAFRVLECEVEAEAVARDALINT